MEDVYDQFMDKLRLSKSTNKATVVYLYGELGSGKTTFVKNLCKKLGLGIDITSPTFTILKKYLFSIEGFENLIHIDVYRLKSYDDLLKIKFEDYLKDKKNLIFIEWPSIIENENIHPDISIRFDYEEDFKTRKIKLE